MTAALRRLLACEELDRDVRLRLACASLLLFFCHSLGAWQNDHAAALSTFGIETQDVLPSWIVAALGGPAFPAPFWTLFHLSLLYFLGLLGLLFLFRKDCLLSMAALALLFLNKTYYYLSDLRLAADYHHIHLILTFLFLISRDKLFFFRAGLMLCYLLLASAKLNPSWLRGEFFLSTGGAVPLLPADGSVLAWLCPLWVLWEALGPLTWLSSRKLARNAALGAFAAAHVFSATVGKPDFAILMLPVLLTAFWNSDQPAHAGYRLARRHGISWAFLGIVAAGGLWHLFVPGDIRLTGEGRLLAFPMPEVNRAGACRVEIEKGGKRMVFEVEWPWSRPTRLEDGTRVAAGVPRYTGEYYSGGRLAERLPWQAVVRDGPLILFNPYPFLALPYDAVGPYALYLYGKRLCRDYEPDRLSLRLDLQLDGRLERERVVDVQDFCALGPGYSPLGRNDWISVSSPATRERKNQPR